MKLIRFIVIVFFALTSAYASDTIVGKLKRDAENGDFIARYTLNCKYLQTTRAVETPAEKNVRELKKAAEQGDVNAQYKLGISYEKGEGVARDLVEAVRWFRKASKNGCVEAQRELGICYSKAGEFIYDPVEGVRWLKKAAEQGDAKAQVILGIFYETGIEVEKNPAEAVKWYRKAAEQGDAEAQLELCLYYYQLENYNPSEGEKWLKKTSWYKRSMEGDAAAQWYLGCNFEVKSSNIFEAVKWYTKSAERGHIDSQRSLADTYYFGRKGLKKNPAEAVKWYRKVAEQGDVEAQYMLGFCYERGEGVIKDPDEAYKWYIKAAMQGNVDAQSSLFLLLYPNYNVTAYAWGLVAKKNGYDTDPFNKLILSLEVSLTAEQKRQAMAEAKRLDELIEIFKKNRPQ
jgi:Sel1 repeat protein